jgi:glycerophosphoryl diester phosphodiesterase
MRRWWIGAGLAGLAVAGVYAANASWVAPVPEGAPRLLAHRGVHQTYRRVANAMANCEATRMNPPTNPYLENTLPSMQASFAAGADAIEVDVHPTTDGEFAVFHDWVLECKTNGRGVTREQTMKHLRTLDLGHGYTADGGKTFPFRGKGVGMMKTLHEVLTAFPGKRIMINVKSADPWESEQLVAYLKARGHPIDGRLWVYAERGAHDRLRELAPRARVDSRTRAKACATRYLALGWTGHVPAACRGATLGVPLNLRHLYWGWPNRLLQRMEAADVEVLLAGPLGQPEPGLAAIGQLNAVPERYSGMILTDHIERLGPEVQRRWKDGPRPSTSFGTND